jgi:hypothetical protein
MGSARYGAAVGAVLCACALDVNGTMPPDAGDLAGQDAGMGVTIADAAVGDAIVERPMPMDASSTVDSAPPEDHAPAPPPPSSCDPAALQVELPGPLPETSMDFGTFGPVCVRYKGAIMGWGISNGQGRMVTLIGATMVGPLDATLVSSSAMAVGPDGFVYWALTKGNVTYASMFAY